MSVRIALALLALTSGGCQSIFGLHDPDPRSTDGSAMTADASDRCFGTWTSICFSSKPTGTAAVPATLSTDVSSPTCEPTDHPEYCVIGRQGNFSVSAVRATGARPLVIIATGTMTIDGALDVSSRELDGSKGPVATNNTCAAGQPGNGHDGGYGGSFEGSGGGGGTGGGGSANTNQPGATQPTPSVLRGGCAGRNGNGANAPAEPLQGGVGGEGGGAIYLIAGARIEVNAGGMVDASGAGGRGGLGTNGHQYGGGGGGSGGMIVLDAPMFAISGSVFADGGGGGGGAADGAAGAAGKDPQGTAAATGGLGGGTGSTGGIGSHDVQLTGAMVPGAPNDGGGGGGGGAGWILIPPSTSATTSPPAMTF